MPYFLKNSSVTFDQVPFYAPAFWPPPTHFFTCALAPNWPHGATSRPITYAGLARDALFFEKFERDLRPSPVLRPAFWPTPTNFFRCALAHNWTYGATTRPITYSGLARDALFFEKFERDLRPSPVLRPRILTPAHALFQMCICENLITWCNYSTK